MVSTRVTPSESPSDCTGIILANSSSCRSPEPILGGNRVETHRRARKRAALACQSCRERKVRCNVVHSGPPCINCVEDGTPCRIVARGRGIQRLRLAKILTEGNQSSGSSSISAVTTRPDIRVPNGDGEEGQSPLDGTATKPAASTEPWTPESIPGAQFQDDTSPSPSCQIETASTTGDAESLEGQQDGPAPGAVYSAILDHTDRGESDGIIYVGEPQGLAMVVDICEPNGEAPRRHYVVPRAATKAISARDFATLQDKGCFLLPNEDTRCRLLQSFFHHVHPFMPIIDVRDFLTRYNTGGPKKVNLLLFWSILFAGVNFLDDESIEKAGFQSRKMMKQSFYKRAKALYDADYEKDKIPLIQSVILLSFWLAEEDDREGSWQWHGIAISLSQSIGLHRNPISTNTTVSRINFNDQPLSNEQYRLWRLIWWMCYVRDAWLSFGMGRPMRIHLDDCDMPMPTAADVRALYDGLQPGEAESYLPNDTSHALPKMWQGFFELSLCLGQILRTHYRVRKVASEDPPGPPIAILIERDRKELVKCRANFPSEEEFDNRVLLAHLYHLCIYYEAATIGLHRPYITRSGDKIFIEEAWRLRATRRAKSAASNINSILNKSIASQTVDICHPMMVTALIPALQINLLCSISRDALTRSVGRLQLDICMLVLSELRKTYWAADFIYSLFAKARAKLLASGVWDSVPSSNTSRTSAAVADTRPPIGRRGNATDSPQLTRRELGVGASGTSATPVADSSPLDVIHGAPSQARVPASDLRQEQVTCNEGGYRGDTELQEDQSDLMQFAIMDIFPAGLDFTACTNPYGGTLGLPITLPSIASRATTETRDDLAQLCDTDLNVYLDGEEFSDLLF